eukprot:39429_1
MSEHPFSNYWISMVILPGYFILWVAFFMQKRKLVLQERGQRTFGKISKMSVQHGKHGKSYHIKYTFTHDEITYETSSTYSHSQWITFSVGQQIEIIYDPRNARKYNLPYSKMNSQTCWAIFLFIFSLIYIFAFGICFGFLIFKFEWYHFVVTTFVIPFFGFIFIGTLLYCFCVRCCNQYGTTKQLSNNILLESQEGVTNQNARIKVECTDYGNVNNNNEIGKVNFSGHWKLVSWNNIDEYYKSEGYSWMSRKFISKMSMKYIIEQTGNNFDVHLYIGKNGKYGNSLYGTIIGSNQQFEYTDPDTSKGYVTIYGNAKWNVDKTKIIMEWYRSNNISKKYESVWQLSTFGKKNMIITTTNDKGKQLMM